MFDQTIAIASLTGADFAADIIERTSSTPVVQRAVELSLAPAFLLVGIGSLMNVMMSRLIWIAGRVERLSEQSDDARSHPEIDWLCARRHLARRAILFSTAAAVVISLVIALLFVSVYIEPKIGTLVAFLWVATVGLQITGLIFFFRETRLASRSSDSYKGG